VSYFLLIAGITLAGNPLEVSGQSDVDSNRFLSSGKKFWIMIIQYKTILLALCLGALLTLINLHFNFTAYGQNIVSTFQREVKAIDDMPALKVKVGDIDVAYKRLGNNTESPIVLIGGGSTTMDMWNPILLRELSSKHTVIIFDNRGTGESTLGTRDFSIKQFADDVAHLLDALDIEQADILGFSMGSFIAQEIAIKYPTKVNSLILYGSSCGGKEGITPSLEAAQALDVFTKEGNTTRIERDKFTSTMFPPEWLKANPTYENYIPFPKESVSPEIAKRQIEAIQSWWEVGTCNALHNISNPTLLIVGTDDVWLPAANSLMLAEKIPGAWLVQIKDAGHGLMNQYPNKFSIIVSEFLEAES
jgi:pimeloyl-ACP methyl ester carboxylesterase